MTASKRLHSTSRQLALEPRLLFDGAAGIAIEQASDSSDNNYDERNTPDAQKSFDFERGSNESQTQTVVVIDSRVPQLDELINELQALDSNTVHVVAESSSGFAAIRDALSHAQSASSLHIISYSSAGTATLGSDTFNANSLQADSAYAQEWAYYLTADADIQLYGYSDAQADDGQQSNVQILAHINSAEIAALAGEGSASNHSGVSEPAPISAVQKPLSMRALAPLADFDGAMLQGPSIESIVRQTPSFETTNAETVTFRVTFNEAVTGVSGSSFVIAPGSISGATIQLVQQVDAAGTQFDVIVSGLNGAGRLNIDLAASSGVMSADGNSRPVTQTNPDAGKPDHSYIIDRNINLANITGLVGGVTDGNVISTNQTSGLQFSGTADAGDTVRLYIGKALLGTGIAGTDGKWTITYEGQALVEGEHAVTIRSSDKAGNTSTSTATLRIDTTAPELINGDGRHAITASDVNVELQYNEGLLAASKPLASDFVITGSQSGTIAVENIAIDGHIIRLTLSQALISGETVKISYTGSEIKDLVGNTAWNINEADVENSTKASNAAPEIVLPNGADGKGVDSEKHQFFSKGEEWKNIFAGAISLSDKDDGYLESATVTVTGSNNGGDLLQIIGSLPNGIELQGNEFSNGVLTLKLTGHACLSDYAVALGQIQFKTTTGFAEADKRTVTVVVNDGQSNSAAVSREIRIMGEAFFTGATETAYLVDEGSGKLKEVNLVMNALSDGENIVPDQKLIDLGYKDGAALALNALAFSKIDGHMYAFVNSTQDSGRYIVRINSDNTASLVAKTNITEKMISGDIDGNGVMYLHAANKSTVYRIDVNPNSNTYGQWLNSLTVSGDTNSAGWYDMAFSPSDNAIYAAAGNTIYKLTVDNSKNQLVAKKWIQNISGITSSTYHPMQYFDSDGYFYFAPGTSGNKTIYRLDVNNPNENIPTKIPFSSSTPTTGDAGRDVTIHLDYGDANDSYKTSLEEDGARHNQLNNSVWLGHDHDDTKTYESDAKISSSADSDTYDNAIAKDNAGKYIIPALREGMTQYSITIAVNNEAIDEDGRPKNATLIGWIDFNKDGQFTTNEAATVIVKPGDKFATLTWEVPKSIKAGDTFARFRITSETKTLGDNDPWNQAKVSNVEITKDRQTKEYDPRSFGARMDGEVEDYKITIQTADTIPPYVIEDGVTINDGGGAGPRYTPVGEVKVEFSESVKNVNIDDFVLIRRDIDGKNPIEVDLPIDTPIRQDANNPEIWYIDLRNVTNPTGMYTLEVKNGPNDPHSKGEATVQDDVGNELAQGGSVTFIIDNTAP